MDFKKLWPTLIPVLALVVGAFSDQLTTLLSAYPTVSLVVVTVVTALANIVNPLKKPPVQ